MSTASHHPDLSLPRVLCLHGGGTNARIFRAQCRVLERSLSSTFRLCYAQAPFTSQPGSDVTAVYKSFGPFRAWLRWRPDDPELDNVSAVTLIENAVRDAIKEDDEMGGRGAWIAVLGFSQGAKIGASLLFDQQLRAELGMSRRNGWPEFKFGVLLAGRDPLVSLSPELGTLPGMAEASSFTVLSPSEERDSPPMERLLTVPTLHVHGLDDPGLELHRKLLSRCCDAKSVRLIQWEGEHRVPIKTNDISVLINAILAIARETGAIDESDLIDGYLSR
ncbi:hypothetical protein N7G274_009724 [Stereocaulon virgatum]|uniref:Serine hydrolase domain-containing protein n=1 Tax=Stereocaulon virgatum TaxID=373712 RepID=A0ABR3ZY21_9LECA